MTDQSPISVQPPAIMLLGSPGSGKTYSLSTLLEAGLEVFTIVTEPHGLEVLLDAISEKKLPLDRFHWRCISPTRPDFTSLVRMGQLVSISDQGSLASMRPGGERSTSPWIEAIKALDSFKCEHCGKEFGSVTKLGPESALVIDSLSGLNTMAMDVTIGDKVTANPGEWGIAMRQLDKLILACTSNLKCLFVLTGHIEKEADEITGASKIMASSLGKKLAPTLPRYFSEVVLAEARVTEAGKNFTWSTATLNFDLKNRSLPTSSKLSPTFQPIVDAFRNRLKLVQPKTQ